MTAINESASPVQAEFQARLEKTALDVYPASSSSLEITMHNRGDREIAVDIAVESLPEGWASLSQNSARLDSDESAFVYLRVAPPRRADVLPGDYPATIVMRGQNSGEPVAILSLLLRLHGFGGLSLALEPARADVSEPLQLFLLNQGNEALRLAVSAWDPQRQLDIDFEQRSLLLKPGQRESMACWAGPRSKFWIGKPREIAFALLVEAQNDCAYQAAMPASVLVQPRISSHIVAAALLILAALALALITTKATLPATATELATPAATASAEN